ncbi:MAG: flagellar hook-length control protein FliK [Lachnospiraceae bacterium]|nr:flagellar hook-length control protein FliK [Lachnospiraceae bacterium]
MRTQGISLVASSLSEKTSGKSTKVSGTTFDSFMSDHASGMGQHSFKKEGKKLENALDVRAEKTTVSKSVPAPAKKSEPEESFANMVDFAEASRQLRQMLQEVLGLSKEELQDILNQSGIDLGLLVLQFNFADNTMWPVAVNTLQNLLMDVHGITDKAAFLTNSVLGKELTMVLDKATDIIGDALKPLMYSTIPEEGQEFSLENFAGQANLQGQPNVAELATQNADDVTEAGYQEGMEMTGQNPEETFQVLVESQMEDGTQGEHSDSGTAAGQTSLSQTFEEDITGNAAKTGASLFTERLAEAFKPEAETSVSASRTMTEIVEQVIHQVKVRVMPETTSMELQLHPASLGKVNLQVSSQANGMATAMLVVENQAAKEALESQMITLKQTFEEQGLKVEAVEVTVSEFGLDSQSGQKSQEQSEGKSKDRRFREEAGLEEGKEEVTGATEAARRDEDSVVDYTA